MHPHLLSKQTTFMVVALSVAALVAGVLVFLGIITPMPGESAIWLAIWLLLLGSVLNFGAWLIAFADAIQERRYRWAEWLVILLPTGLGALVYSLYGPRSMK